MAGGFRAVDITLILFNVVLYQRGALTQRGQAQKQTGKARQEDMRFPWIYPNSLSVAFELLFAVTFGLHAVFGAFAYNEQLVLQHRPSISFGAVLISAKFWSSSLETWHAEYLSIAIFMVLRVFLRQQSSAESKPTESSNKETCKADD